MGRAVTGTSSMCHVCFSIMHLEAVISMDMVSRHIKRQEKKYDSLMVNLEYTIPKNRLDF